ncbi:MAG: glycoside hydrolase [Spirochaetaceae bacterium]|nr:glycoside hydrolase [Spirochaetaceae bacterium]
MKNIFAFKILPCVLIFLFCTFNFSCATKSNFSQINSTENEISVQPIFPENVFIKEEISNVKTKVASEFSQPHQFTEVWGYLLDGREHELNPSINVVTDVGYFGAGLNTFGKLVGVPNPDKLKKFKGRIHLVIIDNSRSLTHFCLNPKYDVRKELIEDIVKASKNFDGVQIDFELVSSQDEEHYLSFLKELKRKLGKKTLSVVIPARIKTLEKDAYHYSKINEIVDRIIVMAYDEHWATSKPGAVASINWCQKVMSYALSVIPKEKLVMGLPFYGRGWSTDDTAGAYRFPSIERLQANNKISEIVRENAIPSFEITKQVTYKFYYDDLYSLVFRMRMYKYNGVKNLAFWRLGQEETDVWNYIKTK